MIPRAMRFIKKKKKILRIKRSRLELGDGERALIKESFPASSPGVSRELCGPNEPHPPRKSHHQPSFPSEKIAARFRSFISTSTRHIYRFSAHPPVPEFHFLAGCRCRCHPDPEKDRIFLTLQSGGGELKRTLRRIKEG